MVLHTHTYTYAFLKSYDGFLESVRKNWHASKKVVSYIYIPNAIHGTDSVAVWIAEKPREALDSKPILLKNCVCVNAHVGLCDFGCQISLKNCPAQFAYVFEVVEARPTGLKIGSLFVSAFPSEGNRNNTSSTPWSV